MQNRLHKVLVFSWTSIGYVYVHRYEYVYSRRMHNKLVTLVASGRWYEVEERLIFFYCIPIHTV